MEEEVDSRYIAKHGEEWDVSHGPLNFDNVPEDNWSFIIQAANHWHEGAAELVTPFRQLPNWLFDDLMISYSTPGGGVGPHIDQYDVFITQGSGKRRWRVGPKKKTTMKKSFVTLHCAKSRDLSQSLMRLWNLVIFCIFHRASHMMAMPSKPQ